MPIAYGPEYALRPSRPTGEKSEFAAQGLRFYPLSISRCCVGRGGQPRRHSTHDIGRGPLARVEPK